MKRIALIILGAILVLVGLGFVLPALAKLKSLNYLPTPDIRLLLLGILLLIAGPIAGYFGGKKRRV